MYKSSNFSYVAVKYIPLFIGLLLLIIAFWIMIGLSFEITVNNVKRNAVFSDGFVPLIIGLLAIIFYFTIGQRIVKMKINNNNFEFKIKGIELIKNWDEVETIKKYWIIAPPLYSVKFENDNTTYLFTTAYFCITLNPQASFTAKLDSPSLLAMLKKTYSPYLMICLRCFFLRYTNS